VLGTDLLKSVAEQLQTGRIVLGAHTVRVERTSSRRLRTARFRIGDNEYQAIEQNPDKPSRWGQLARQGHAVVQFRDLQSGKYVAVAVDGEVSEYSSLKGRRSARDQA
jgi:hypothetical protein